MNREQHLVAAAIKSRRASEAITALVPTDKLTPQASLFLKLAEEYYDVDKETQQADWDVIGERLTRHVANEKRMPAYTEYLREARELNVSAPNITELIVETRRQVVANDLGAALLGQESKERIAKLFNDYNALDQEAEEEEEADKYYNMSVANIVDQTVNPDNLIKIAPPSLNKVLEGGVLPGTNIIIYKRPESGGSALAITIIRGLLSQGLPGIYFMNEDPTPAIIQRMQSSITGMKKQELADNTEEAQRLITQAGWGNFRPIPLTPGTPWEIEKYIKRYKPSWIVVDQIRHLEMKEDTKVNKLEAAANFMRNMAKKYSLVSIGVTQAGDSAEQKLILGMSDIDNSKTGIPGAVDLMIGLGTDLAFEAQGMRMISLPKNKITGVHVHFPVRINTDLSRIEDV